MALPKEEIKTIADTKYAYIGIDKKRCLQARERKNSHRLLSVIFIKKPIENLSLM